MINREDVKKAYDRIAKQRFGATARATWSDTDPNVIEIHTAQIYADVNDIDRFNTSANLKCWITTNDNREIIICRET